MRIGTFCAFLFLLCGPAFAQASRDLTPSQLAIQQQQQRLNSSDVEERRDAVMRLGAMRREAASRAALQIGSRDLPPSQQAIQQQQQRLNSSDVEERRDAVMRLGAMRREAASRAAL